MKRPKDAVWATAFAVAFTAMIMWSEKAWEVKPPQSTAPPRGTYR